MQLPQLPLLEVWSSSVSLARELGLSLHGEAVWGEDL